MHFSGENNFEAKNSKLWIKTLKKKIFIHRLYPDSEINEEGEKLEFWKYI